MHKDECAELPVVWSLGYSSVNSFQTTPTPAPEKLCKYDYVMKK